MLTLAEILERFTTQRVSTDVPTVTVEPMAEPDKAPIVVNGMAEMLEHIANQEKRIAELESELAARKNP